MVTLIGIPFISRNNCYLELEGASQLQLNRIRGVCVFIKKTEYKVISHLGDHSFDGQQSVDNTIEEWLSNNRVHAVLEWLIGGDRFGQ